MGEPRNLLADLDGVATAADQGQCWISTTAAGRRIIGERIPSLGEVARLAILGAQVEAEAATASTKALRA